jgi:hypothetical protein
MSLIRNGIQTSSTKLYEEYPLVFIHLCLPTSIFHKIVMHIILNGLNTAKRDEIPPI